MKKYYMEDKQNSLFYDSGDLIIEKVIGKNKILSLEVSGVSRVKYKGGTLVSAKDFSRRFKNDLELENAENDADWEMINNNWFEIILTTNEEEKYVQIVDSIKDFEKILADPEKLYQLMEYMEE